jgi:hypothetical protein
LIHKAIKFSASFKAYSSLFDLIAQGGIMNASTGKLTGILEFDNQIGDFYRLRSELLDCFADIERSLLNYIMNSTQNGCCITAPLGHKIEAAKKVAPGPQRSKELKMRADVQLSKLAEILPLRADIVHSRMEVAVTSRGKIIAIFRNAKDAKLEHPEALVFEQQDLMKFVDETNSIGKSLEKALTARNAPAQSKTSKIVQVTPKAIAQTNDKPNPQPLLPQPSLGAAGGL